MRAEHSTSSYLFSPGDLYNDDSKREEADADADDDGGPVLHQVLPRQVPVLHLQVYGARYDVS